MRKRLKNSIMFSASEDELVLDRADHVIFMEDGVMRAEGGHRALLATRPDYAATVTRSE